MKLTTQLTIVICVGIVSGSALVYGLAAFAHWPSGAVVGLIGALGVAMGTLVVQLRSNAKLADQDKQLDTIVRQTNGLSDQERQDIAQRAVETAIASLKESGHL
jgi:hypothetical protein